MNIEKQQISQMPKMALTFIDEDVLSHMRTQFCNEEQDGKSTCEAEFDSLLEWLAIPPKFTTLRLNSRLHQDALVSLCTELNEQYRARGNETPTCQLHPQMEDLAIITNIGPCNPPLEEKEVVVGLACGMAVLRGANVYAQGIVAAPPHLAACDRVSVMVDVEGAVCKGLAKKFTGKKLFVGNGVTTMGRTKLFGSGDKPTGLAISMTSPLYVAPSLAGLLPSVVFPQNLPSVVCSHVLSPQPDENILDMCAAPGGKTTHIATLMGDQGRVIALDKSKNKISTIEKNVLAWDLTTIRTFHFDATKALDPTAELSPDVLPSSPPFAPATFDRVLLDAPCSALGQRPAIANSMKLTELTSYSPLQRKLFTTAVGLLKPGGVLVYSTCTWTLEENEKLVAWALNKFPEMMLSPQTPHIGGPGRPVIGLLPTQLGLLQRFGPPTDGETSSCDTDTIGFFCAKFVKAKT